MSENELSTKKHYYTIGEVAKLFKVSTSLLRYWEKDFKQLRPQKTKQGIRKYTQADINELKLIYDLVKIQGYTIRGAQETLSSHHKKSPTIQALIAGLKDIKSFLVDLQQSIHKK